MDGAETLLEGQATLKGTHHDVAAGLEIRAISIGLGQRLPQAFEAVHGNRFSRGIVARRQVGLDAVGKRIETSGCSKKGWQAERQLGITDRAARNEVLADEAELATIFQGDERRPPDFRPSAGRRGDGDQRSYRAGDARNAAVDSRILLQLA